jgi:hypothetical protein
MERTPDSNILQRRVTVPKHVVFRDFVSETVLLNIETGQYHGLNPVAGRMLSVLDSVGSVEEAARRLAQEFEQPLDRIETDLAELCEGLIERRLLEIAPT